ncbi:hypothetical protein ACFL45_11790 [Candidatus Neomarinimicrobiota bacterium]
MPVQSGVYKPAVCGLLPEAEDGCMFDAVRRLFLSDQASEQHTMPVATFRPIG